MIDLLSPARLPGAEDEDEDPVRRPKSALLSGGIERKCAAELVAHNPKITGGDHGSTE